MKEFRFMDVVVGLGAAGAGVLGILGFTFWAWAALAGSGIFYLVKYWKKNPQELKDLQDAIQKEVSDATASLKKASIKKR